MKLGFGPHHGVVDDLTDIGVEEVAVGLMARLEVEDAAVAAFETAATAEYFTTLEPADEYQFVGGRNAKMFTIHFFVFQFKIIWQTLGNGVGFINNPKAFFFANFTPFQVAGGAHQ